MANYLLRELAGCHVQHSYALLSCVQIAAYNLHLGLLRPEPFWLDPVKVYSGRREADVLMPSVNGAGADRDGGYGQPPVVHRAGGGSGARDLDRGGGADPG